MLSGIKNIINTLRFVLKTYPEMYNAYKKKKELETYFAGKDVKLLGNNDIVETEIGKYSYVSFNTIIHTTQIGRYCSIGPNCVIGYGSHPINLFSTSPLTYYNKHIYSEEVIAAINSENYKKVIIGNDVWIGANVFVKNGVSIGDGAVVGAGAVVLKDVPPYSVVAGVPAKIIKFRFSPEKIQELQRSEWWLKDLSDLEKHKINIT